MQRTVANKILSLSLAVVCLFMSACGQKEQETTEQFHRHGAKAYELRQKGDLVGAIEEQKKAVELKPDDSESLTVLAGLYLDLYDENKTIEQLEKAKTLLLKALEINPKDAIGHDMLAGTYDRLGDKQNALKQTEKVVELDPNDIESLTNLALNQDDLKDTNSARQTFEKVLQKNPNYAYALYHYAEFELEKGNRLKAIELFERGSKATTAADNGNGMKYIEVCRKRLEELKNEKANKAQSPNGRY